MTKIYVTRHGETEWNKLRRMQGRLDSPLTELGKQQALWLGERLETVAIDHLYSSPAGRAMETATLINQFKGLPIKTSDKLQEIYLGGWEGKTQAEIEAYDAERYVNFWNQPECYIANDGESFESIIQRSGEQLEWIASTHAGETVLVVAHAVVLKSMIAYVERKQIQHFWQGPFMKSTCLNCFEKINGEWQISMMGDTSHYPMEIEQLWANPK